MYGAFQLFLDTDSDVVFSGTPARRSPYYNQVEIVMQDNPQLPCPSINGNGSPPVYDMNNSIFVYKGDWLRKNIEWHPVTFFSKVYMMEDWQFCDVDTQLDFELLEFLMRKYHGVDKT